jgi:hypothetical protein
LRDAVAAGGNALDAWFAALDQPQPDTDNRVTRDLRPGLNLGLLTDHPTPARRDRMVGLLAHEPNHPVMTALIPLLGRPRFPSALLKSPSNSARDLGAINAIPAAMTATALADMRAMPEAFIQGRSALLNDEEEAWERMTTVVSPRICDWTAAHIIQQRTVWTLDPLPAGIDTTPESFLAHPVIERDKTIATLKKVMAEIVRETEEKSGWAVPKEEQQGNRF